jgi:hypothetical protein
MHYCELVLGNFKNRGLAIQTSELGTYQKQALQSKSELYRSYYYFDEEILEHLKIYKSVRSFKGSYYLDQIVFDIDAGVDSDQFVHERAKAFVDGLINDWNLSEEHIRAWFSGRGFHIVTPDFFGFSPGNKLPQIVRATLNKYFPNADDIYDHARIIRVGRTINLKTKLYKILIPLNDLFNKTTGEILARAKEPVKVVIESDAPKVPKYADKIVMPEEQKPEVKIGKGTSPDNPTRIVTCMQKVIAEGPTQGSRHQKLLRLASTYRRAGVPTEIAVLGLAGWANNLQKAEVERIVKDVYQKGYRFGCDDELMSKYCDPGCIYFKRKDYTHEIMSAKQMEKKFMTFVRTNYGDRMFDLAKLYKLPSSYKFYPGELVIMWGDTGLGKTTFVQNLCVRLKNMKILYLSLEVHENLLYRRFAQIVMGWTKEKIVQYYQENNNSISDKIEHIKALTVSPDIEAIKRLIAEERPAIVVIDTLDGIAYAGPERDKVGPLAITLKEYAQQMDTIIFVVHHISKDAALDRDKNTRELNIHSGKGSSSAEQKADKVIGIEGNPDSKFRTIRSLKARDEEPFTLKAIFDKETFRFTQLK